MDVKDKVLWAYLKSNCNILTVYFKALHPAILAVFYVHDCL